MEPSLKTQRAWAKARECLEEARVLLAAGKPHGAINRAYYAMFHAAEAALLARYGLAFSSHGAVIGAFGKHFAKAGLVPRRLHQLLIQAFDVRSRADYDVAALVTLDEAQVVVAAAQEFCAGVRPLIEGEAP